MYGHIRLQFWLPDGTPLMVRTDDDGSDTIDVPASLWERTSEVFVEIDGQPTELIWE